MLLVAFYPCGGNNERIADVTSHRYRTTMPKRFSV